MVLETSEKREWGMLGSSGALAGSDGKDIEKKGKACEILCRIYAKSVENVKIGSNSENGGFFRR